MTAATRGKSPSKLARVLLVTRRAIILLAIWLVASIAAVRAMGSMLEHRRLASEVAVLENEYQCQIEEYTQLLTEGDRIENDHNYQIEILKKRFGYTEPDETPIVILPDT